MAVDLVNTHEQYSGTDSLVTVEDLAAFLAKYEGEWHDTDWCEPEELEMTDVAEVRTLRDRLRTVWDSGDVVAATKTLNGLLEQTAATPRISLHGQPHLHFEPGRGRVSDWLGSASAMALSMVLVQHGYERLGTCHSKTCVDVFVDTSRNRSRQNCSTTCTTRENVAAYRKRSHTAE